MKKGFTLIEILIVIALIGVLTAFGLSSYLASQRTARDSRRTADMKVIQNSLETYFSDNSAYPNSATCDPGINYLPQGMPKDPQTNSAYAPTGSTPCSTTAYCFCTAMERGTGGNSINSLCNQAGYTGLTAKLYFCVNNLQ